MLFGAWIEPRGKGQYRLVLSRQRRQWSTLAWAVITAMLQDHELEMFNFRMRSVGGDCIEFSTRSCQFLGHAWQRWYGSGEVLLPADMVIKDRELLFLVLGAWKAGNKTVKLNLRGREDVAVKSPWPMRKISKGYEIYQEISEVEAWLETVVPRKVFI